MDDNRHIQDCARAASEEIVGHVRHLLRPEEVCDFFWETFAHVQAAIESYREIKAEQMRRLAGRRPSDN